MGPLPKKRVWFYRASALAGAWFGVPRCRPPIWFGGDEFGRRTIVFQLPGVGCMIVALWGTSDLEGRDGA